MGRRTLLLLASILVAAAGTALIWVYVQNADHRAQEQWGRKVTVLQATSPIEAGTGAAMLQAWTKAVEVPEGLAPEDAVSDVTTLANRVATVPVLTGQFLQQSQFQSAGSTTGIAKGMQAVTINVEDANRVAGLLHPNMIVAVYYVAPNHDPGSVAVLATGVKVLAVGNTTVVRNAGGRPAQIGTQSGVSAAEVTLEVDRLQAKQIIMAASKGSTLWFTALGEKPDIQPGDTFSGAELPVAKG